MKNKIFNAQPLSPEIALFLFRLILGVLMLYHGYTKLISYDEILPHFGDPIGLGRQLSFNLVIFAEFFCALFVIIGLFTRLAVIPIIIDMTVAFLVAHANDPFEVKEKSLMFLTLAIAVFVSGSGRLSIDALIFRNRRKNQATDKKIGWSF